MKQPLENRKNIAIIGGGASGMAAAIAAARTCRELGFFAEISLFELQERLGKKLLSTGNGRCNLGNLDSDLLHYHGENPHFVTDAFQQFDVENNMGFFQSLGVMCREEENKLYPYSNQASSVLDALRLMIGHLNVDLHCGCKVFGAEKRAGRFLLQTKAGDHFADKLIITAGGLAAPDLGGTKSGYQILENFGHRITALFPSLVQIKIDHPLPKALKGIKIKGNAALYQGDQCLQMESGEILFTEYGLSGPPILQLSRKVGEHPGESLTITLDFLPDFTLTAVEDLLAERQKDIGYLTLEHFLNGLINKKTGQLLIKHALKQNLSHSSASLTKDERHTISLALKAFPLPVHSTLSWKNSQATAGGASTADFDPKTLRDRTSPTWLQRRRSAGYRRRLRRI